MLRFRGQSEHVLDPKGRLNVPSRFREVLREVYSDTLMITKWGNYLKAFPMKEWHEFEEQLLEMMSNKSALEPGMAKMIRQVLAGATESPIDKQGRVLVPSFLRSELGIGREVVLNGLLKNFEIWDKAAWVEESKMAQESFADYSGEFASLGVF